MIPDYLEFCEGNPLRMGLILLMCLSCIPNLDDCWDNTETAYRQVPHDYFDRMLACLFILVDLKRGWVTR